MNVLDQIEKLNNICPLYKGRASKRDVRHEFFKNIQTEIQAYLLGFHAADGNLNYKRYTIAVKLTELDKEIVYLFKDFISPEARIDEVPEFIMKGRNNKEYLCKPSIRVNISSKELANDLINIGFGENKTYSNLHLPNIPKELIRHFIRGYFDGDGTFTATVSPPNKANREVNPRLKMDFNFCGKTRTMLDDITKELENHGINMKINYLKRDDMYKIHTGTKNEVKKAFDYLYKDSNFYLQRKFDKFNYYVNTEVSQIITDHRNA